MFIFLLRPTDGGTTLVRSDNRSVRLRNGTIDPSTYTIECPIQGEYVAFPTRKSVGAPQRFISCALVRGSPDHTEFPVGLPASSLNAIKTILLHVEDTQQHGNDIHRTVIAPATFSITKKTRARKASKERVQCANGILILSVRDIEEICVELM